MTPAELPPAPLREKLWIAAALAVFCNVGFFGIAHLNAAHEARGAPYAQLETVVDGWIAFDPRWIWIYLSYYPGCFLPIVSWNRRALFRQVALGYAIEFGACFVCFGLIQARMAQPAVVGDGWNEWAVRRLFEIDKGFNIFPSLHCANALFVAAIVSRWSRRAGVVTWIWAVLICISTMTVKQHYAVDVVAGVALAALTIHLVLHRWDGLRAAERDAGPG